MKSSTISFRDAYSFLNASSMISSALSICLTRLCYCGRVHPWQFGAQTHQSPPTHSSLLGGSQTLHFHSAYFPLIPQCGWWRAKSISEYRFESHNYCTVEWNRYCSIQTRSSSFCLFTFHNMWYFVAVIYVTNVLITNVFAKTLNLQLWMMCMVFHCVWLVKSVFDLLK